MSGLVSAKRFDLAIYEYAGVGERWWLLMATKKSGEQNALPILGWTWNNGRPGGWVTHEYRSVMIAMHRHGLVIKQHSQSHYQTVCPLCGIEPCACDTMLQKAAVLSMFSDTPSDKNAWPTFKKLE